ncbi:MAG: NHL repeat-containing protein [Planctomycetota bacterium]|nr:NHL repeat-containing protein [Planctomycetota bacterium]
MLSVGLWTPWRRLTVGASLIVALSLLSGCGYIAAGILVAGSGGGGSSSKSGNALPTVTVLTPARQLGAQTVTYTLTDAEGDEAAIGMEYAVVDIGTGLIGAWMPSTAAGGDGVTGLTTSATGEAHTYIWDAATDLGDGVTYVAAWVRLRVTPAHSSAPAVTGTPQETVDFVAGNDAPTITFQSPAMGSVQTGVIPIDYRLIDTTSDPADLEAYFTVDQGAIWATAEIRFGETLAVGSAPTPGATHTLAWDSGADMVANEGRVQFRLIPTDAAPGGTGMEYDTLEFEVRNDNPPIVFIASPITDQVIGGDVTVSYRLLDDLEATLSITVEYSIDSGTTFQTATMGTGGEGTTGLTSSVAGVSHTFVWASGTDAPGLDLPGAALPETVAIRITPFDSSMGLSHTAVDLRLDNNSEPTVQSIDPFGPGARTGDVTINFTLADPESDASIIAVSYSIDGGGAFLAATLRKFDPGDPGMISGNEISGLPTSPGGTSRRFIWQSGTDLPGARETAVVLRIEPRDHATNFALGLGAGAQTSVFAVDNTSPPVINTLAVTGNSDTVPVTYDLYDAEPPTGPTVDIDVTYSLNGIDFFPAAIANPDEGTKLENVIEGQTPSNVGSGAAHSFDWDTVADLGEVNQAAVTLRLIPMDSQIGAAADFPLGIFNNDAPMVNISDITGVQSRDVPISYSLQDSNADTCSIVAEYRIGTGVYLAATESLDPSSDGTTGLSSSPDSSGAAHTFIWDSLKDLTTTFHDDLEIRITASDPLVAGTPTVSNLFTLDNAILADLVLGKPTFDLAAIDGRGINAGWFGGLSVDGERVFIADYLNSRVLILDAVPVTDFQTADVVLGQEEFTTGQPNVGGFSARTINHPSGVYSDGTILYVADSGNHRVLIWNDIPTANFAPADHVLGHDSLDAPAFRPLGKGTLSQPTDVCGTASHLYVADFGNNRVLVWNLPLDFSLGEGPDANFVLGQADGTSKLANRGGAVAANTLNLCRGVFADGTTLFVADSSNNRVLMWTIPAPWTDGLDADGVLGQPGLVTAGVSNPTLPVGMHRPLRVFADSGHTYVADHISHRVLIWNSAIPASSTQADVVLGQPNFNGNTANNGGISDTSFDGPTGLASIGTELLVLDGNNHRVKIHDVIPVTDNAAATLVFGQKDFTSNRSNHAETTSRSIHVPGGIDTDGNSLFVADRSNHRVLGWETMPAVNEKNADFLFGHSTFSESVQPGTPTASSLYVPQDVAYDPAGSGRLFVADSGNHRVMVYDGPFILGEAAVAVLGQITVADRTSGVAIDKFNNPVGVAWDGSNLWVADGLNHRVLRFAGGTFTTGMDADLVLGQANFVDNGQGHSGADPAPINGDQGFSVPNGLSASGGKLLVADTNRYRILIWDPIPTMSDAEASLVLGQTSFGSFGKATSRNGMDRPEGVESDGVGVYVSDSRNQRVLLWDTFPTINGQDADRIIGQADFDTAIANEGGVSARSLWINPGVGTDSGRSALVVNGGIRTLWVPDQQNDRVLRYDVTP